MSSEIALTLTNVVANRPGTTPAGPGVEAQSPTRLESVSERLSDEQLLRLVGTGDGQALGDLFQRHGRSVLNVAFRILRDPGEADDLRQEVFLYLHTRAALYDPAKASAASWIIQIAYHRAIDRRRFLNCRHHYQAEALHEHGIDSQSAPPSADHLDGKVVLQRLRDQLSNDQRQTLELHFFEGYTFQEIASKSGQSVGNVRHHYYRALERLRSILTSKNT